MSVADVNDKYLNVGYKRREIPGEDVTLKHGRSVMGRKGIGKLSLFSIANIVEVHTTKGSEHHGFTMNVHEIKKAIEVDGGNQYQPEPVSPTEVKIDEGTKIILSDLKRELRGGKWLRRRLARRFSIIGSHHNFRILLDDEPITIEDRDYYDKLQYLWTYGKSVPPKTANSITPIHCSGKIENTQYEISGWIGTAEKHGQLKDPDTNDSINKIVIMVRGKLAQEDILEEFGEGGYYSNYIIGEIHADFLDQDSEDDIATTSRQQIIKEDPRYVILKTKIRSELKKIQNRWNSLRHKSGYKKAIEIPSIRNWYEELNPDHQQAAKSLLGKVYQLPIDKPDQMRQLLISSILAFESLRLRNLLHKIEKISVDNIGILSDIFTQLNDLEASAYYQITKERLAVIRGLTRLVDEDEKEKALQKYLFRHLWLLDPSWERATHTARMEKRIYNALDGIHDMLPEEQRLGRLDIKYTTTGNKHVIVELKRASRRLRATDLVDQIDRYRDAVAKVLSCMDRSDEPLEFICIVGKPLTDWTSPGGTQKTRELLKAVDARVVTYEELINNALQAYQDYVEKEENVGRIYKLISSINEEDLKAMSP